MRASTALIYIGAFALTGCSGTPTPVAGPVPLPQNAFDDGAPVAVVNTIAAGDTLSVIVYREPDASLASVVVDPLGNFQMPLLGNVVAEGKAPAALAAELAARLDARFLVRPKVSVNVVNAVARRIVIEGAVASPGIVPFEQNLTLVGAMALARGPLRTAKTSEVVVFRNTADERYVGVFNLEGIRAGRLPDVKLQPGDMVVVGVSGTRQAWQDVLSAAPLIGFFTRF